MITSYVSIDLETTGLNPKLDKIIEIGAVKVIEGEVRGTYHTYINPGRKLEERIIELTGIEQKQVDEAPGIEEVFPELVEFLGDLTLLGHRILFDYSFLKKAAVNMKMTFEKQGIDTLRIARCFLPQLEHRTLPYLCEYYQIEHDAHRALADAEATSRLYEILCEAFYGQDERIFKPEQLHYAVKKDTPATKAQKEQLYRVIAQYNLVVDYDVEKLTRSEASRTLDKIRSSLAK
jgi:DNA polymerase-3 subunit alpha (Gram-positive type)